jgi:hypothetical protein
MIQSEAPAVSLPRKNLKLHQRLILMELLLLLLLLQAQRLTAPLPPLRHLQAICECHPVCSNLQVDGGPTPAGGTTPMNKSTSAANRF